MVSTRVPANLAPNRLAQALAARRRAGGAVIDLTESNPTRAGFDYPLDLLTSLADPRGLTYSPDPLGLVEAREAVAAEYKRRGEAVDVSRIVLTASTSEAYSLLFKVLADPGGEVLVPKPSYPLFDVLTTLDGVIPHAYDLDYDGHWSIDLASVERALTPQTRAILLVSPNNPTGSFVSSDEVDRLAELCRPRGAALIVDEVFADYPLDDRRRHPASVLARTDVLTFSLGGLSKAVGLPQLKLGWIAASGPDQVIADVLERLEVAADAYLSVGTPVQLAAPELLRRGAAIRRQIAARIAANYQQLKKLGSAEPACRVLTTEGGWYSVLQVPTYRPEEELILELLDGDGVLAHPGYFFDFPRESFVIVSLLPPEPLFAAGVERVIARATRVATGTPA
jgi:aspartate/methionine/tyrosine aminotransferase